MKQKILIGMTGSVASKLSEKIVTAFEKEYYVSVILTERAKHFISIEEINSIRRIISGNVYEDHHEWNGIWCTGDEVLHIKLRDEYSALVIVPATANTIAKINYGVCDNLLTSVALAWEPYKPMLIAPAMNTVMWENPKTEANVKALCRGKRILIKPQVKMLACGHMGDGALANISDIVKETKKALQWSFPLQVCYGVPITPHPGAFAYHRKGSQHTGIDLYTNEDEPIYPVEDGVVVGVEHFTGEWDASPWWENTDCVLVRGASGVVVYGELTTTLKVGDRVWCKDYRTHITASEIGRVKRVIKKDRFHYEIPGWRPTMLHLELYPWDKVVASKGFEDFIIDPTEYILNSHFANHLNGELPPSVSYEIKF